MVRIPTWFTFSAEYEKQHGERIKALRANASKPWTNDMLFDTVLGITGVTQHPYYTGKQDISSPCYDRPYEKLRTIHGKLPLTADPVGLQQKP